MIINRIQPILDPFLRNNQNGKTWKINNNSYSNPKKINIRYQIQKPQRIITFVDFKKAFNTINRN